MSYDFHVYGKEELGVDELAEVATSVPGLKLPEEREEEGLAPLLEKDGEIAFTLEGPYAVDATDIPEEWAEAVGFPVFYSIQVTYDIQSSAAGFTAEVEPGRLAVAEAFATKLAARVGGVLIDPQAG